MNLLLLDADGVFMNEEPYWKAALATALCHHDLALPTADDWQALSATCFGPAGVQRITKGRGCNSNWDMAAVMVRALDPIAVRADLATALARRQWADAAGLLGRAMEALWNGQATVRPRVAAFGIDRRGPQFREITAEFQDIFEERRRLNWPFARHELRGPASAIRAALASLRGMGWTLGVCTSRDRHEIVGPMHTLDIADFFDTERIVTGDEVAAAQRQTGLGPLHKPHWFPLLCGRAGLAAAVETLRLRAAADTGRNGHPLCTEAIGRFVYVGDTPADYESVVMYRDAGGGVDYVHVDAGLTDASTDAVIRGDPATRGVVSGLPEVPGVLDI